VSTQQDAPAPVDVAPPGEADAEITVYPPAGVDSEPWRLRLTEWNATVLGPPGVKGPVLQVGGWAGGASMPEWAYDGEVAARLPGRGELPRGPVLAGSWGVKRHGDDRDPWVRFWLPAGAADRLRRAAETDEPSMPSRAGDLLEISEQDPWGAATFTLPAPGRYGHPPCPACATGELWLFVIAMAESDDPDAAQPAHQINAQAMTCRKPDGQDLGPGCAFSIMVRPGTRVVLDR
jgi:hypothetical protein